MAAFVLKAEEKEKEAENKAEENEKEAEIEDTNENDEKKTMMRLQNRLSQQPQRPRPPLTASYCYKVSRGALRKGARCNRQLIEVRT